MSFADDYVAQIERLGGFEPIYKSYFKWILENWDSLHPRKEGTMPLFEVAIIEHPTKKDREDNGAQDKLIMAPKPIMARDLQAAAISACLGEKIEMSDRVEVLVRPFA